MKRTTLTEEEKILAKERYKEYQKEYHKNMSIELKRKYRKQSTRYKLNEQKRLDKLRENDVKTCEV